MHKLVAASQCSSFSGWLTMHSIGISGGGAGGSTAGGGGSASGGGGAGGGAGDSAGGGRAGCDRPQNDILRVSRT